MKLMKTQGASDDMQVTHYKLTITIIIIIIITIINNNNNTELQQQYRVTRAIMNVTTIVMKIKNYN